MTAPTLGHSLLYLSQVDVDRALGTGFAAYFDAVEGALVSHARGDTHQPLKPYLKWRGPDGHIADRIIAMPAHVGGAINVAGIKWIGSKHDNAERLGLPRASGIIVLNDVESHVPIAFIDAAGISGRRTAAVSVLAAARLARARPQRACVIGSGFIGGLHVSALRERFPELTIAVFDQDPSRTSDCLERLEHPEGAYREDDLEAALSKAEIVVTATVTGVPYLTVDHFPRGCFISNVSIMDVAPESLREFDQVIVDDWDQANREGKVLHQAVDAGQFSRAELAAELGNVLDDPALGRQDEDERILLIPMGLAIEDVACAAAAYRQAVSMDIGTVLPFGQP